MAENRGQSGKNREKFDSTLTTMHVLGAKDAGSRSAMVKSNLEFGRYAPNSDGPMPLNSEWVIRRIYIWASTL
jgi:hypothetical protein